jgi:hypothetical protein
MQADAFCKLLQLAFIKSPAWIGGGYVDEVDGEVLECAAVLHDDKLLLSGWESENLGGRSLSAR